METKSELTLQEIEKPLLPSPFLNDTKGFLGLQPTDYLFSFLAFCLWSEGFRKTNLEPFSLPLGLLLLAFLIFVRSRSRTKIIQTLLFSLLKPKLISSPLHSKSSGQLKR